jgi:uncharacterized membrane protein
VSAISTTSRAAQLPQRPVTIADERIGLNGAIAAALTRWVGSMPALYVVLAIVAGWMALATWGPLHRIDPYPFAFLLFLDNVVQLVLCSVILVGQRVLGMAADRRAVQTYENAEAIFEQVADLQEHLDRHDRALSRGVSLLESSPHPWIQRHRVQPPPQAIDQVVSVNGRVAAWLTQRLGSMWVFYTAGVIQVVWIGLAQVGAQRFDPYPFAFMTFLSTLAQLIFMVVIMVGQDVLGRAADRRSEQTFLDAEAILHECRRMKARLTAQDRVIDSLSDYTTTQVTERLAQAIHNSYLRAVHAASLAAAVDKGAVSGSRPSLRPWEELPDNLKESNRAQARQVGEKLAAIGCLMVPTFDPSLSFAFDEDEVQLLARLEHERWMAERIAQESLHGSGPDGRGHPDLVPWEQLSKHSGHPGQRGLPGATRWSARRPRTGGLHRRGVGDPAAGDDGLRRTGLARGGRRRRRGDVRADQEAEAGQHRASETVRPRAHGGVHLQHGTASRHQVWRLRDCRVGGDPLGHRHRRREGAGGTARLPRVPGRDRRRSRRREQRGRVLRRGRPISYAQRVRGHASRQQGGRA